MAVVNLATKLHWQEPPPVLAPSHQDRAKRVRYGISKDLTGAGRSVHLLGPLYRVWAHLEGMLPPIPNVTVVERDGVDVTLCTLLDAIACFQGVNRPHGVENNGDTVLTYVLKVTGSLSHASRLAAPIRAVAAPPNTVLTVQVALRDSLQGLDSTLDGLVTRLEPVVVEPESVTLPAGHTERYSRRCW